MVGDAEIIISLDVSIPCMHTLIIWLYNYFPVDHYMASLCYPTQFETGGVEPSPVCIIRLPCVT